MSFGGEEDVVRYWIYPTSDDVTSHHLADLHASVLAAVGSHAAGYLWNCERFNLRVASDHLTGSVSYKENVEDEWFVIGLLKHASVALGGEIAVRVTDSDGEILLIEAADALPRWAQEPDNAEGRAWIFRGEVHLIPRATKPSEMTPLPGGDGAPPPAAAAKVVAAYPEVTRASDAVQKCVSDRLGGYPADWAAHAHVAHARLPRRAAALLQRHPQLLSQAVHHVTGRDARDGKLLRNMTRFQDDEKSVTVALKFTKYLYALIASEKLLPYKKSGWSLPGASEEGFRSRALGFRLCAGLEILASRAEKCSVSDDGQRQRELSEEELKRLNRVGYFGDLLPGSKDYNALYESAKNYIGDNDTGDEEKCWDYLSDMKSAMAENWEASVATESQLEAESDDSWLTVDQSSFDAMLGDHFKLGAASGGKDQNQQIPAVFKSFLEGSSDMKGVEQGDEIGADDDDFETPLAVTGDSLKKAFEQLMRLSEPAGDEESSSDEDDDEEYMKEMEAELKKSNIFQENNLGADENLLENLMSSVQSQEDAMGPASTLLKSFLAKK